MAKLVVKNSVMKLVLGSAQGPEGIQGPPGNASQAYDRRCDVQSNTVVYKGEALPGSPESEPVWKVQKITITYGAEIQTKIEWAEGSENFKFSWADHLTYNYQSN